MYGAVDRVLVTLDSPGAVTRLAGILDDAACPATNVTGARHRKEPLLITNLAGAAASRTRFRLRSGFGSRTFTRFARLETRNPELGGHAFRGFFERDLEVVTKIRAALRRTAPCATASTAENITKPKQVAENVFNATKSRRTPVSRARTARHTRMPESVVTPALFGIGQHAVRLGGFFKLLFRARVVGILVRVILHRQPPVGTLDLLIGGGPAYGKHFIIITFTTH